MHNNWQESYAKLTAFISEHADVSIERNMVRIPDDLRAGFYRLFNDTRKSFLVDNFSHMLDKAGVLIESYLPVKTEVCRLLGLENISMSPDLLRFLSAPEDQLMRGLYDPLFDLLKGLIDPELYKSRASKEIEKSFHPLYLLGYEKWVVLSLVSLLEASALFRVVYQEATLYDAHKGGGLIQEQLLDPEKANSITFQHAPNALLMIPDLIIRSPRMSNKCVAFRSQIGEAFGVATGVSPKMEYCYFHASEYLHPTGTFVCIGDDPGDVSLVADEKRICRPDLIIECWTQENVDGNNRLERIKQQHNIIKPRLGTYIVSVSPSPEEQFKQFDSNMYVLEAGFKRSGLTVVADALARCEKS